MYVALIFHSLFISVKVKTAYIFLKTSRRKQDTLKKTSRDDEDPDIKPRFPPFILSNSTPFQYSFPRNFMEINVEGPVFMEMIVIDLLPDTAGWFAYTKWFSTIMKISVSCRIPLGDKWPYITQCTFLKSSIFSCDFTLLNDWSSKCQISQYIYPTSLYEQDVTQGQFFSRVNLFELSFPSPWLAAIPRLKSLSLPYYLPMAKEKNSRVHTFQAQYEM